MGANPRTKGAGGEREIADDLNYIVYKTMKELGMPNPTMSSIQRNQNQSAVGGCDLTGTFNLAIEVKRQEALSVNTWWQQCTASAQARNETPVLLYRQNGKKWRCVLMVELPLQGANGVSWATMQRRAEISWDDFKEWFAVWARKHLETGYEVKV